ncbi:MAG: 3-oxoacyl-ACP reductase FabG [Chloroflexi bacterium]|nr:3-oxoacyl-ACP reductase FabG [Chloroflexota bacterium]
MSVERKGLLEGRVALVTGASRGIGRATALAMAREGAAVAVNAHRSAAEAEAVAGEIAAAGGRAMTALADVADPQAVQAMVARVQGELGPVDVLVNNAGASSDRSFEAISVAEWNRILEVNLGGVFHCCRAVLPGMKERRYGRIVCVSSLAGVRGALNDNAQYAASKAGVHGLVMTLARRMAPYGITVNAVAPGPIETEMFRRNVDEDDKRRRLAGIPVGRFGQPEDIAQAALFLASDWASYITGVVLPVGGGFHMG